MVEDVDVVVIGAGVVGLACARALALAGREVWVLEKNDAIGMEVSSHNSEVIHAGIYYPPGSLKALLCVRGKEMLYKYCQERAIPHRQLGKIVVASNAQQSEVLAARKLTAEACGVDDLRFVERSELAELEPEINAEMGLLSPSTGIIDSHALMLNLQGDIENNGGTVVCRAAVSTGEHFSGGMRLHITGEQSITLRARLVVNAGGLHAVSNAHSLRGGSGASIPKAHYAKGHYYTLMGKSPFQHLVYPLPTDAGLGVHVTLDMAGQTRFGPNVHWQDGIDYRFEADCHAEFVAAISNYYPRLDPSKLVPAYTGIRPKIVGQGEPAADFVIATEREHGVPGLVNLFGIESPGLTACLSIAERVGSQKYPVAMLGAKRK